MPTLAARLKFAERHIRDKTGKAFSIEDRSWVRDDYWLPVDGFHLWPVSKQHLCDACKDIAGDIIEEDYHVAPDGHEPAVCRGLYVAPIICTVLSLKRRSGKTFNTAAYAISAISLSSNENITYVAASEDQTDELFRENYLSAVQQDPMLMKTFHPVVGSTLFSQRTNSYFECVSTSHSSITGRGRTKIIVDEARDIPARVITALLPSVFAECGIECKRGHTRRHGQEWIDKKNAAPEPMLCDQCGDRLVAWYGRILIMSSMGLIEGGETDWHSELVAELMENPHPNFHLFASNDDVNPSLSKVIRDSVEDVFGKLDSTRDYIDIEINNVARRKGEDYVTKGEIERCCDARLANVEGSDKHSVSFLDTSTTVDKTSWVIVADDVAMRRETERPWTRLVTERIDFWKPEQFEFGIIDQKEIQAHLDRYMPMFPMMKALYVDTRIQPWAMNLVKFCRQNRPWGKRVHDFNGNTPERNAAWEILQGHLKSRTIRIIESADLKKELRSVRAKKTVNNQMEVRDRNRRVRHADIAEGLAECCRQAFLLAIKKGGSSLSAVAQSSAKALVSRTASRISDDSY